MWLSWFKTKTVHIYNGKSCCKCILNIWSICNNGASETMFTAPSGTITQSWINWFIKTLKNQWSTPNVFGARRILTWTTYKQIILWDLSYLLYNFYLLIDIRNLIRSRSGWRINYKHTYMYLRKWGHHIFFFLYLIEILVHYYFLHHIILVINFGPKNF